MPAVTLSGEDIWLGIGGAALLGALGLGLKAIVGSAVALIVAKLDAATAEIRAGNQQAALNDAKKIELAETMVDPSKPLVVTSQQPIAVRTTNDELARELQRLSGLLERLLPPPPEAGA